MTQQTIEPKPKITPEVQRAATAMLSLIKQRRKNVTFSRLQETASAYLNTEGKIAVPHPEVPGNAFVWFGVSIELAQALILVLQSKKVKANR